MVKRICLFEDHLWRNFAPVTLTRPVYELVTGMSSLRAKITRLFPDAELCLLTRDYLAPKLRRSVGEVPVNDADALRDGCTLFVNGRAVANPGTQVPELEPGTVYRIGDEVVAAYLDAAGAEPIRQAIGRELDSSVWGAVAASLVEVPAGLVTVFRNLWELVLANGEWIRKEFPLYARGTGSGGVEPGASVRGEASQLYLGEGAVVLPGVVLDVTEGPIFLSQGVKVKPPTLIEGPTFVGTKSLVDGAKIRESTTIGPVCKVGGEVEASIVQSYSNKHHDGFLGHAYVGQWVNLGALVTNSDLKNNYGSVKVQRWADQAPVDSGETFVGCSIGDHSKLGIGVMITTGATVGMSVNWTGSDTVSRHVPSFVWHTPGEHVEYRLNKAAETATAVMKRRKLEFDEVESELLRQCFEVTAHDRAVGLAKAATV
jgi:UDP-N-acetylglucosamine diphosphorylase/glucosamine-1-phosphate N-acetyltransferase